MTTNAFKTKRCAVIASFMLINLASNASGQTPTVFSPIIFAPVVVYSSNPNATSSGWIGAFGVFNTTGLNLNWNSDSWQITNVSDRSACIAANAGEFTNCRDGWVGTLIRHN
jgi:hypothetical protein